MGDRKRPGRSDDSSSPQEKSTERFGRTRRPPRDTTQSQPITAVTEAGAFEGASVEANIIIIAHPRNKLLGTRYRLVKGTTLEIGRSPTAEVSLPEVLSISRNHARIQYLEGLVVIEDLGSTNGTYVNDRRIGGPTVLRSGDRFQVGAVHFKFLHEKDVEHAYHEAIFDLVTRDGLTGIANKRKFDEEIEREFARAKRYKRPLSVIFFDVDHFKSVNDTHGHLAGDFVLKQLAARVAGLVRPEQVFARVGGEEFAILCPETDGTSAALLSERLREAIRAEEFSQGDIAVKATCSFGVGEMSAGLASPQDLCEAADRALYLSKNAGRNKVTIGGG
jgi:two-component system cell cycle response regulator